MRAITIGFACNNACVFCAQGDLRAGAAKVDVAAAITTIERGDIVCFQGGEPTLLDDLPALLRAAGERGAARVIVQTNGRRLSYKGYTRALREASPVLALDVSLHGSSAPMHEYHTSALGSFAQTIQGLRNARAERIPTGVTTVITRSNFRHLQEITRLAHAAGAVAVHFAEARALGRALRDRGRVVPAPEMVAPHLARAVAEAQRLGLGIRVGERTTGAAAEIFAGIGDTEPVPIDGPRPQ